MTVQLYLHHVTKIEVEKVRLRGDHCPFNRVTIHYVQEGNPVTLDLRIFGEIGSDEVPYVFSEKRK